MKQNKNNANALQILKIETHSRVVGEERALFTASTLGPCTVFSLPSSNNYLMSVIHIFRTDNALYEILYSESQRDIKCTCLGVHMCVCVSEGERQKQTLSTTGKNPSRDSSPLVIQIRRTIFQTSAKNNK
jgi:hypothetical protein